MKNTVTEIEAIKNTVYYAWNEFGKAFISVVTEFKKELKKIGDIILKRR